MDDAIDLRQFEAELVARWCAVIPMVPADCDLKKHLCELRSISDVMATRQTVYEPAGHCSGPSMVR